MLWEPALMNALQNHILSAILAIPIAGALVILLIGKGRSTGLRRAVANVFAGAAFLLTIPLWVLYDPYGKTWQFAERLPGIPPIGASYYVGVDGFSILLILLTTFLVWLATLASRREGATGAGFYAVMLLVEAGIVGVFMALDFLLAFVCWEMALVLMYAVIRRGDPEERRSAGRFLVLTFAGSAALVLGILTLYFYSHTSTGVYSLDITLFQVRSLPFDVQKWIFAAFFVAFAATVSLFPFQAWAAAGLRDTPAASVVLPALVLKMGAYGFIRFTLPVVPDAARYFAPLVMTLSVVGIGYGAFLAIRRQDRKRLIAGVTISYMAVVMLAMFAVRPAAMTASMVLAAAAGAPLGISYVMPDFLWRRDWISVIPGVVLAVGIALYPAPVARHLETVVGRVLTRINPAYASRLPQGSDCPTTAAPAPGGPPPGFILVEPCADDRGPKR